MRLNRCLSGLLLIAAGLVVAPRPSNAAGVLDALHDGVAFGTPGNGPRSYEHTDRGDYAQNNFQAEVTVIIKGGGGNGCAYFGMGKGVANPASYNEPTTPPSVCMRLCPSDFVGGLVTAATDGQEPIQGSNPIGDGTHRIRLTWDATGKRALFEVCKNWDGQHFRADSTVTADATTVTFGTDGNLFVVGAGGIKFADFSTQPLSAAEIKNAGFGESFHNDPSAGTWLSVSNTPAANLNPEVTEFLKPLAGSMRLLSCWYAGSKLIATRAFTDSGLRTQASQWSVDIHATPVAADRDAMDLTVTFKLTEGGAVSAGVAAAFDFADWNINNYVLIPASVYNGNRERIVGGGYANGLARTELYCKDLPLSVHQLPHLELDAGKPSMIEVSACNASTPAICLYCPKIQRAFMVLAEQGMHIEGKVLDNGLMIEESPDRSHATLVISAPGVRQSKPEFLGFSGSPDRGIAWKTGDTLTLRMRLYSFETSNIPGMLDKFMSVRKAVTGPNHPRNIYPMSEVIHLMTNRIDGRFYNGKDFKFYGSVNAAWQCFGWVGGLMNTFPMLALGDETHLDRVSQTFDFSIPRAQGKAGYFYEVEEPNGKVRAQEAYGELPELSLSRRNGDVLFWMIKQFKLLKAQNKARAIKPEWEAGMRHLADAFVATWKKDGQWGNYVNVNTGEVAVYNSTSGVMGVAGLALAAEYFHNPEYLQVAQQAANYYYDRDFVKLGMTTGACADILQNADSETAAGFMTALMALYDTTGDAQWLKKSQNLANLCGTWTVSYDYEMPPKSQLAQLGTKIAGAVWASTQNKHGAPGICTSSGDPLFKIYRATGGVRYADLMHDILHAHAEGIQPSGEISERLTYCDADSRGSRGSGSTGWNELNGILMAMELPGIYLRTDEDRLYVFDAVEVKTLKRDASGITLQITNPTKFPARVSIFAEDAQHAKNPLGYTAFLTWPKVDVNAGDTGVFHVGSDGAIVKVGQGS
jgi:hypothetical protein